MLASLVKKRHILSVKRATCNLTLERGLTKIRSGSVIFVRSSTPPAKCIPGVGVAPYPSTDVISLDSADGPRYFSTKYGTDLNAPTTTYWSVAKVLAAEAVGPTFEPQYGFEHGARELLFC